MLREANVKAALEIDGYALLREYCPSVPSLPVFEDLGEIDTVEGLATIQHLTPKEVSDASPNTYSGNFGTSSFPLHTDLAHWARPPRYLVLRCIRGSADVATRLQDGKLLIAEIGVETLRMALVQPRRPMHNGRQLLRILERVDEVDILRIRWDSIYLRSATSTAQEVLDRIACYLKRVQPVDVVLQQPGDTLLIDNWRVLHGRSATTRDASSRHIDRVYMRFIR